MQDQSEEITLCTNPTFALVVREMCCVVPCAWCPTEGSLVFEHAAVADTTGFSRSIPEHWITSKHSKALSSVSLI